MISIYFWRNRSQTICKYCNFQDAARARKFSTRLYRPHLRAELFSCTSSAQRISLKLESAGNFRNPTAVLPGWLWSLFSRKEKVHGIRQEHNNSTKHTCLALISEKYTASCQRVVEYLTKATFSTRVDVYTFPSKFTRQSWQLWNTSSKNLFPSSNVFYYTCSSCTDNTKKY